MGDTVSSKSLFVDMIYRFKFDQNSWEDFNRKIQRKQHEIQNWMQGPASPAGAPTPILDPGPTSSAKVPATEGEKQRSTMGAIRELGRTFGAEVGQHFSKYFGLLRGFVMGTILGPMLDVVGGVLKPLWVPVQNFFISMAMALRPFVDRVVPVLQNFFMNLSMKYGPALAKWMENLGERVATWFKEHRPQIESFFETLFTVIEKVAKAVVWCVEAFSKLPGWLQKTVIGLIVFRSLLPSTSTMLLSFLTFSHLFPGAASKLSGAISGLLTKLGPAGWLGVAAAAGVGIGMLLDRWFGISDKLGKVMAPLFKPSGTYDEMTPDQVTKAAKNRDIINARSQGATFIHTMPTGKDSEGSVVELKTLNRKTQDRHEELVATLQHNRRERFPAPAGISLGIA